MGEKGKVLRALTACVGAFSIAEQGALAEELGSSLEVNMNRMHNYA